jgi:hypothetical protein
MKVGGRMEIVAKLPDSLTAIQAYDTTRLPLRFGSVAKGRSIARGIGEPAPDNHLKNTLPDSK